jgi:excinuclease UvrABC nuclease subunit
MTNRSGIYRIINIQNDHCYIGSAVNLMSESAKNFYQLKKQKEALSIR